MPTAIRGLLADANAEGHARAVLRVCESAGWAELWNVVKVPAVNLANVGLAPDVTDRVLWGHSQDHHLLLITINRNHDGPESLEAAIRMGGKESLPVLTIADGDRVLRERLYVEQVAERLLEILLDLDNLRGTGRLYLP